VIYLAVVCTKCGVIAVGPHIDNVNNIKFLLAEIEFSLQMATKHSEKGEEHKTIVEIRKD